MKEVFKRERSVQVLQVPDIEYDRHFLLLLVLRAACCVLRVACYYRSRCDVIVVLCRIGEAGWKQVRM